MRSAARHSRRAAFLSATSVLAAALATPQVARAETGQADAASSREDSRSGTVSGEDRYTIVVIGDRSIIVALKDVAVEDTYDEDAVAGLGASTVGEALEEIRRENGDEQPAILVNGRPISNPDDVANLPVEAVARIEKLPPGSAAKVNGVAGQRAYNVVLRPSVKSATLTASREQATEGGWHNTRGEALFTYIKGQDRINLTVRAAKSDPLYESERDFIPRTATVPYSPTGNIVPAFGAEIDPALSNLAGQPVSILALPPGLSHPTLAALLAGAGQTNPSLQEQYRTLRGASRPIDVALAGNKTLNPWLSLSFNARLGWTRTESIYGLPSARFLIPQSNGFTPFSTPVYIALNDPARPLENRSEGNTQALGATLNADLGPWRATMTAKWDRREQRTLSQFGGTLGSLATVADTTNPFGGALAGLIPVSQRDSQSIYETTQFLVELMGPVVDLWAGPVSARASASAIWMDYAASDPSGSRGLSRHEYAVRAGLSLPLTSRERGVLGALGDSDIDLDVGRTDLGAFGSLDRRSIAFNWQPVPWLRLVATDQREERAVGPELLSAPVVSTPNVPYFDPVTGETVDVTTVYGGAGNLVDEDYRTRTVGLTLSPLKQYGLQLTAEYARNDTANQVGALPPPSTAVALAFPERFVRDTNGTLVLVDNRSINFARQTSEALRFGLRLSVPLSQAGPVQPRDAKGKRRRTPAIKLTASINHTILLNSTAVIRAGLPEVDLLAGGAIGIGGGQQRHSTRISLTVARGGTGLRLDFARRGASALATGTAAAPDLLAFDALSTLDVRAFADLGDLFPRTSLPRGTRISLNVDNLFNQRQRVTNLAGATPQAYQPVRRDAVGRTVMVELRTVF